MRGPGTHAAAAAVTSGVSCEMTSPTARTASVAMGGARPTRARAVPGI